MTSPHTRPAERETPAGEAMREALARLPEATYDDLARACRQTELDNRRLASELARLTAERDGLMAQWQEMAELVCEFAAEKAPDALALVGADRDQCLKRALAAEAALTTQRADHAAEVARLTEALRFYADEDAWSGQPWRLQFESPGRDGHGSDTARDALATTETTDA